MSSSPFFLDQPSPPLQAPKTKAQSPQSRASIEAFPDFPSSPISKSSPVSHHGAPSHSHLEVPGTQGKADRQTRPARSPSQRLPPTALLPSNHNASRNDLSTPTADYDHDKEEPPHQRLPRALPAPSLSGPSIRPTSIIAPNLLRGSTASTARLQQNAEEIKSESLWADMQRTLADVELSAMQSSHLFNAPHAQALEKLRETQLALAQAWARSEADETNGQESEDEFLDSEPEGGISAVALPARIGGAGGPAQTKSPKGKGGKDTGFKSGPRDRQGSTGSNIGRDLEEETERDIKIARKRREANDHYFSQVNRGVLDVVARLDEVANAMKMVERENRAVWEEMDGAGSIASLTDLDGDTDESDKAGPALVRLLTEATTSTGTRSGTEVSNSPVSQRRAGTNTSNQNSPRTPRKTTKDNDKIR